MHNDTPDRRQRPALQQLGAIAWPSFVVAALAGAVLLACIDPRSAYAALALEHPLSPGWICTVGFLALWLLAGASSAVTCLLMRNVRQPDDYPLE